MEVDHKREVVDISVSESGSFDVLNFEVDALRKGVVAQMLEVGFDPVPVFVEHVGELLYRGKPAVPGLFDRGSLTAARNSNTSDWWVVIHRYDSNCYSIVPVTAAGVGPPQERCVGMAFSIQDSGGQACFSPNGTKYARVEADNGLVLMRFDAATGLLSKPVELTYEDKYNFADGACFSGNSCYLYITASSKLYQFDTEAPDIQASGQLVGEILPDTLKPGMGALATSKLGPDGKIYIVSIGAHRYISTIERPSCPGTLCDFRGHSIPLSNYTGINNLPHFRVPEQAYSCEAVGTAGAEGAEGVKISPNPASSHVRLPSPTEGLLTVYSVESKMLLRQLLVPGENRLSLNLPPGCTFFDAAWKMGKLSPTESPFSIEAFFL